MENPAARNATLEMGGRTATDPMQQSFAALMGCYAQGDAINMQATFKAFPLQLTLVKEYAKRVLKRS